ncbi:putative hydrolase or acyltransferase of alpha/beta superfamily [Leptolyngbya sp. PCC 7375]|nr:putative hydrolase or acyltransferase of alpha/beta superfamily [Leptolyngbya sp. PCC 7375]
MACYLLIHGNRHGKWAWDKVVNLLECRGHQAHAIDLPGHGDDVTPRHRLTLQDNCDAVLNYVRLNQLNNLILVGHSSGGVVLVAIAKELQDRLSALVFVAALVLRAGESQISDLSKQQQKAYRQLAESRTDYSIPISYDAARKRYFSDLSETEAQMYFQQLTPEPFGNMKSVVGSNALFELSVPMAYVICTQDQALSPALCRTYAQRLHNPTLFEMGAGHDVMLSQPQTLVNILETVALAHN